MSKGCFTLFEFAVGEGRQGSNDSIWFLVQTEGGTFVEESSVQRRKNRLCNYEKKHSFLLMEVPPSFNEKVP